ncbi:hypothetical protein DCAR_0625574 [Daucus carota subsp. sativus]|uniref:Uncharacterized protein n=1 Tax=Daucus carota subsp. sativus TaxID=79200 RepID=A0A161ZXK4_DAUCS|nr:hypothetical protein DCAR_0625574 [Daucus carota subsp. sativus]
MMNDNQAPIQFPQPTKPVNAQDTAPFQSFLPPRPEQTRFAVDDDYDHQPQNDYYYYNYNYSDSDDEKNHDHKFLNKLYAKVEEEITSLKASIQDGDVERNKTLGLFKKFGAKLNKKLMKRSEDHGVTFQERGVAGIELDKKLERFKVKTVILGGGGGKGDNGDKKPKK